MEKDYRTASGKFWQTVRRLRRGKQLSANTVYGGGGELLVSTGNIVGRWKEYFEDLLNPTDTPSVEETETEDSEVDSFITQAEVTESGTVPLDWATRVVVPLFKKGDRRVCSNYRGITLLSLPGKVYSRVLERRVRPVREGSWEFAQSVRMCFVGLEKAFDRVPRGILWEVLWEYGVRGPLLRAVRSLYNQSRSLVCIASYDVVLLASSSLDLQHALGCFAAECEAAGMRVSTSKSEAIVLDQKKVACTFQVGGEVLPQVEEFKYLGVLFTSERRMDHEIDRRIGAAAAVMRSMYQSVVVKKELSRKAKLSIYQSIYVPTLTYGHELWVMTERVRPRIQAAEMSFLRRVAGRSLKDRVRSSVTREELGVEPLLLHIERGQLRWLGHLFWMPPGRLPGEVFRACPTGKRPRGRPRTRWRDYVFRLAWERLGVPPEELEEVAREREVGCELEEKDRLEVIESIPTGERVVIGADFNGHVGEGNTDLEKAYDRVPREELWYCMRKSGVAEKYVRVVQDMYERSRKVVRCAVGQTEEFKVEVGLHQGSALSPFLFAMVMDQLSEETDKKWTENERKEMEKSAQLTGEMMEGKRSDSPEPSCVSMKSDQSMDRPINFRDSSTDVRSQKTKSNISRNQLDSIFHELEHKVITLIKNELKRFRKLLSPDYPACTEREVEDEEDLHSVREGALKITLHVLKNMNHTDLANTLHNNSVDVLLTNLIKRNLLPSALLWITSRPGAANQIPPECVDQVTEVRGFSDPQKEEYFRKRISDQSLANEIITHMKSSKSLYIMCHIPVFCWISATVLEKMLGEAESGEIPKTLTQMFTHFLIFQIKHKHQKYHQKCDPDPQQTRESILALGKLAFQQLEKGNLIFYEEDLRECGIDVREVSVYSGVCTQIFREEFGLHLGKVFSFVHLSVQEFLAALYAFISYISRNVKEQQTTDLSDLFRKSNMSDFLRSAVDKALQSENGHLDLFLRFLLGLSLESYQTLLRGLMPHTGSSSHSKQETVKYIKEKIRENPSPEKSNNLFHCLNELNDHSLVQEVQTYLKSGSYFCLRGTKLSPAQWSALVFVLMNSEQELDVFDLRKYDRSEECLLRLLPVVKASRKAM
ncbi:hypothetical protein QTP86_010850 [Hemibagrus guttatus]|nr:hypothetical protein QTP86_010850 [Hemibagrus guttatus]